MTIKIESLAIPAVKLITSTTHSDDRGSFCETWNQRELERAGIDCGFVQDNHAVSVAAGTIRGLHYQSGRYAQSKLVRVLRGRIFDVAVDLRRGSPSFGQWVGKELDARSGEQLWVPAGFAHGYCTLEPQTEVFYKVDNYYNAAAEGGIHWKDPNLGISWPSIEASPVVSSKDQALPGFSEWLNGAGSSLAQRRQYHYDDRTQGDRALQTPELTIS